MKLLKNLLLPIVVCSVLFILIGGTSYFVSMVTTLGCAMSLGCSDDQKLLATLSGLGVIVSLGIFPAGAYYFRSRISKVSASPGVRNTIFAFFGIFPLIMIIISVVGYGLFQWITYLPQTNYESQLKSANVQVELLDNKLISGDYQNGVMEVTLKINNVPNSLPYYSLDLYQLDDGPDDYWIDIYDKGNTPFIKAQNINNKWIFIRNNGENVTIGENTVRATFSYSVGERGLTKTRPTTFTPRLGIWAREDKVYKDDFIFFYKPLMLRYNNAK